MSLYGLYVSNLHHPHVYHNTCTPHLCVSPRTSTRSPQSISPNSLSSTVALVVNCSSTNRFHIEADPTVSLIDPITIPPYSEVEVMAAVQGLVEDRPWLLQVEEQARACGHDQCFCRSQSWTGNWTLAESKSRTTQRSHETCLVPVRHIPPQWRKKSKICSRPCAWVVWFSLQLALGHCR